MSGNLYLTLKTVHIVAIIAWMAGLLYYFRLFVYHFENAKKSEEIHQLLSTMERRLYRGITFPSMILAVAAACGIIALTPEILSLKWFQTKLIAGICMIALTVYGGLLRPRFLKKEFGSFSSKKLRILNEVPALLMIVIVTMVIFRPFN